jgi:endonuclease VIII
VPEGDTVHRAARRLGEALERKPIREAESPNPRAELGSSAGRLRGKRLQRAEARGKHLLLHFDGDLVLHSHLGTNGAWHVYPARARWRRSRGSAWLVLSTKSRQAVQFGGGTLELLTEAELRRHPRLARLGPDVLDPTFTPARGVEALRGAPPTTQLGEALLDQGVIAGIGNVYKSEGCFAARISPWRTLGELSDEELAGVVRETTALMRQSLEGRRPERQVYRRAKLPCPACGAPLRARGQGDANRTTYWCGRCQASAAS